ncbi:MAG: hypothetical protein IJ439_07995 [Tyzzerella sp.]|nr:hypothetical protein [Tyzzerella sp.]
MKSFYKIMVRKIRKQLLDVEFIYEQKKLRYILKRKLSGIDGESIV